MLIRLGLVCTLALCGICAEPHGWIAGTAARFGKDGFSGEAANSIIVVACQTKSVRIKTDARGNYALELTPCKYRLVEVIGPGRRNLPIRREQAWSFVIAAGKTTRFDVMLEQETPESRKASQPASYQAARIDLGYAYFQTVRANTTRGAAQVMVPGIVIRVYGKQGSAEVFGLSNRDGIAFVPLRPGEYCFDAWDREGGNLFLDPEQPRCFNVEKAQTSEIGVVLRAQ